MDQNPQNGPVVEPPRGFHAARVDEKGRLKIPAVFQQYLAARGDSTVFITTIDERTARLYPIPVWKENEKFFEDPGELAQQAAKVQFVAKHYGSDSEIDGQGRVLVPQELRRRLGIENQSVFLGYDRGAIEVLGDAVYQERFMQSRTGLDGAVADLQKTKFK